jgi:heptosyltransferase-2
VTSFTRILVIQTAFLGDGILSIPLLRAIRAEFQSATICLACRRGVGEIFLKSNLVDEVIEVEKSKPTNFSESFLKMKKFSPDLIISPHQSFRTLTWVWRLKPLMSVGFKTVLSQLIFKKAIAYDQSKHDVMRQLSLILPFKKDISNFTAEQTSLKINIENSLRFKGMTGSVIFAPGSQWNTKRWTFDGYVELGQKFLNVRDKLILVGTPAETELCKRMCEALPGSINLCGKTSVFELAQLLKTAKLLVCNDSGTMHVATTVGLPVVSIFGPTVPAQGYAPWSKNSRIVEVALECRPCGAHGHVECPIKTHACMKNITASRVFAICSELLNACESAK